MQSRDRLYIDRLWSLAGVDPRSPVAKLLEAELRLSMVREITDTFAKLREEYSTKQREN